MNGHRSKGNTNGNFPTGPWILLRPSATHCHQIMDFRQYLMDRILGMELQHQMHQHTKRRSVVSNCEWGLAEAYGLLSRGLHDLRRTLNNAHCGDLGCLGSSRISAEIEFKIKLEKRQLNKMSRHQPRSSMHYIITSLPMLRRPVLNYSRCV